MSEPTQPPSTDDETTTHQIPGWYRAAWAVRGVKDGVELIWQREASVDVTYTDADCLDVANGPYPGVAVTM